MLPSELKNDAYKEIERTTDTDEDIKRYVNHILIQIHQQSGERQDLKNITPTFDELKYWVNSRQIYITINLFKDV